MRRLANRDMSVTRPPGKAPCAAAAAVVFRRVTRLLNKVS